MASHLYFPAMWLVLAILVIGILGATNAITYYRRRIANKPALREQCRKQLRFLLRVRWLLWAFAGVLGLGGLFAWHGAKTAAYQALLEVRTSLMPTYEPDKIWEAPNEYLAETDEQVNLIQYGRKLIAHTQDYFGENGIVRPRSINGLDCQSCHLDAGGKPFGNNYFAVASTYPQKRARSGALETIPKREQSYNRAAGLFRMSRFAGYVKANMPFGASYQNPHLTDEEARDLAAFVNSQPRPKHPFLESDWPKIEKKPYDHPFGPFADSFPEFQHKYGPFGPIVAFYKSR